MKTALLTTLTLIVLTFNSQGQGTAVAFNSTAGGLYNAVGPVYNSPQFIGNQFVSAASGWLSSITLPLDDFISESPANGIFTLSSDAGNVVGAPLFSANISSIYVPFSDNTQLPSSTVISLAGANPVFLQAGSAYWLTLSQTTGSGDLAFFSNVNMAAPETVYFSGGTVQYAQGLQTIVAEVVVTVPEPAPILLLLIGLGMALMAATLKRPRASAHL